MLDGTWVPSPLANLPPVMKIVCIENTQFRCFCWTKAIAYFKQALVPYFCII